MLLLEEKDVIVIKEGMLIPSSKDEKAIRDLQIMENIVNFGIVRILNEKVQSIRLTNTSPIDAIYTAFMKTPGIIFYEKS